MKRNLKSLFLLTALGASLTISVGSAMADPNVLSAHGDDHFSSLASGSPFTSAPGRAAQPVVDQGPAIDSLPAVSGPANVPAPGGAAPAIAGPAGPAPAIAGPSGVVSSTTVTTAVASNPLVFGNSGNVLGIGQNIVPAPIFLGPGMMHCNHVVQMLMRDHMTRSFLPAQAQAAMQPTRGRWIQGPFGPAYIPGIGDLELVGVNMVTDANGQLGPAYQVSFRNNSERPIGDFHVSITAVQGVINLLSPTSNVNVPQIAAGAVGTVQIQLPLNAMTMGPAGQLAPFDTLVVAIDSFEQLMEASKLNNIATLRRADVALLVTETTVSGTTVVAPLGGAALAPAVSNGPAIVTPGSAPAITTPGSTIAPSAPGLVPTDSNAAPGAGDPAAPAPRSNVDIDTLDLGTPAAGAPAVAPSVAPMGNNPAAPQ